MAGAHDSDVMSTADRLVHMANQIARNLEAEGDARAVEMTADHIRQFWDPLMRQRIVQLALDRPGALSPIAAAAIERIAAA
ncbi:formate dehydrogenase subunit delta [Sphingopyxis panaciterrae]|uniref:formate dehydrogenase subunit delta n=1 Tax=Sphingopyxis panaciterrae TaxID=363841 RepID=UPI001421187F|nr:formate dehydrogenase subunit delta [Sphingopyxis panaciterrae]NIJ36054.1 formate dehydrogenase subunit delta [Sphingopyxis panaciterrae]